MASPLDVLMNSTAEVCTGGGSHSEAYPGVEGGWQWATVIFWGGRSPPDFVLQYLFSTDMTKRSKGSIK